MSSGNKKSKKRFYLMYEGWMKNPVLTEKKFSKCDAWVWLIENAAWRNHTIVYRGKKIKLQRGEVPVSYRKLAERWGWSINRVRRFLSDTENNGMTTKKTDTQADTQTNTPRESKTNTPRESKTDTGITLVTICNYEQYQVEKNQTNTPRESKTDTPRESKTDTQADTQTNTNSKKYKNYNNTPYPTDSGGEPDTAPPGRRNEGTNPRAAGKNPRQAGTNPRKQNTNPRQREMYEKQKIRATKLDEYFERFFEAFPKKDDKEAARKAFKQVAKLHQPEKLIEAAHRYAKEYLADSRHYETKRQWFKRAATWLKAGSYLNGTIRELGQPDPPSPDSPEDADPNLAETNRIRHAAREMFPGVEGL